MQYESSSESGKQMNVELRAEPFTKRQQRQSQMDGNCDIDDIPRPLVEIQQMIAFGCKDDSGRLVVADEDAFQRGLHDIFEVDDAAKISGVRNPDGTTAQPEDLQADARAWKEKFAVDAFSNLCVNHEHDCKATCINYAQKKQSEQQQPFWSMSNDICQVTDRCNVDYQFLFCAPLPSSKIEAVPESTPEAHSEGGKRRRLTEQSPEMLKQMRADRPS